MRWARIKQNGGAVYGLVEGDVVLPVRGTPFGEWERTGDKLPLADQQLLIPVVPPTFYACGMNYDGHVREIAASVGQEPKLPVRPEVGYRANSALIAHNETIVIPRDATEAVQYEGELVAVVGRRAKNLSEGEALSCLMGYTIGNDVSERSWQKSDATMWRSKNTDTFKPMGPWIETEISLDRLETRVRVNGDEKIRFDTDRMVFGVARYIATMTRYLTLQPGDVIWMGTEGAGPNLRHGDVVEVEINDIGILRNPVVRET